jgi:hypothetical protein
VIWSAGLHRIVQVYAADFCLLLFCVGPVVLLAFCFVRLLDCVGAVLAGSVVESFASAAACLFGVGG